MAVASERYTEKLFADILQQGQSRGCFLLRDPQMTAAVIKAMLQDWYLKRTKYRQRNISVDHYAEFVLQFVEAFIVNCTSTTLKPGSNGLKR